MFEEELAELNSQIEEEVGQWNQIFGRNPGQMIPMDTYIIGIHLEALEELLIELGVVDKDELHVKMKQRLLASMQRHRNNLEVARRAAVVEQLVPKMDQIKKFGNHG